MALSHVADILYSRPWLVTPSGFALAQQIFEASIGKSASSVAFDAPADPVANPFFVTREPASLDVNGIGHLHVSGIIGQGLSFIQKVEGLTDSRDVQAELQALVAQGAKGILLTVDSPGGMVTGTPELAEAVFAVAQTIPVYAFTDSVMASAAYWLAAGATKIISTVSADVGSIGIILPFVDRTGLWEQEGLKPDFIVNTGGTFKAMLSGPSLSDSHRAQLQAETDRIFGLFHDFVIDVRAVTNEATVPESAMQGQCFIGLDALTNGLVDAIGSKQDAYELLLQEIDFDTEPAPAEQSTDAPADPSVDSSATDT